MPVTGFIIPGYRMKQEIKIYHGVPVRVTTLLDSNIIRLDVG